MKRTLFDSEYEKVRKASGYARPRYDLDDPEPEQPAANPDEVREQFQQRSAELRQAEERRAAEAIARSREFTMEANERARLREYEAAGVEPPEGSKVSLSLLLSIGWTIENLSGRPVLARPFYPSRKSTEEEA